MAERWQGEQVFDDPVSESRLVWGGGGGQTFGPAPGYCEQINACAPSGGGG
jgi:hypothetical protein